MRRYITPDNYLERLRQRVKTTESPGNGTCYEDAWRFLIKEEEGTLIHGTVLGKGKRIGHAWVETETGYIWEPQTKRYFTPATFQIAASPIEEHRYSVEEAAIMLARVGRHGPWTDEERARWLPKKQGNPTVVGIGDSVCDKYSGTCGPIVDIIDDEVLIEPTIIKKKVDKEYLEVAESPVRAKKINLELDHIRRYEEAKMEHSSNPNKEPWEMTLEEWAYASAKKYGHGPPRMDWIRAGYGTVYSSHKTAVERAIREGKPVPAVVLADYPELGKHFSPDSKGDKVMEAVSEVLTSVEQFQLPIIPDMERVWVTGSLARGQMTAKSDIDVIVQVSREVFEEPMSFRLKTVEDAIWERFPNADVFFTPKGNPSEMMQIPAWMKPGGKVDASIVKGLWEDAKVVTPVAEVAKPPAVKRKQVGSPSGRNMLPDNYLEGLRRRLKTGGGNMDETQAKRIAEEAAVKASELTGSKIAEQVAKELSGQVLHESPISPHCERVLEEPVKCYDFRGIRSWVLCKAWDIMEEEKRTRLPVGEAWRTARAVCVME